jgi:hypothetical protein
MTFNQERFSIDKCLNDPNNFNYRVPTNKNSSSSGPSSGHVSSYPVSSYNFKFYNSNSYSLCSSYSNNNSFSSAGAQILGKGWFTPP